MSKRVFVSFRYSDIAFRNDLESLFQNSGAQPVHVVEDVAVQGEAAIRSEIQRHLQGCHGLVVVVGNDAHNSRWIDYEVQAARSARLPCVAIRHPRSSGGLPNGHKDLPLIDWSPASLKQEIARW